MIERDRIEVEPFKMRHAKTTFEVVRTACSVVSAAGVLVVLGRAFGVL